MCESFDTPQCNRQPFLSESGCDRGNVDIHQFDDLPYCGIINPTNPDVPPEIPNFPTSIPVPTYSCSCVNIRYNLDFKYDNKSSNEASFRAVGDCCEGNYISNFKLRIPCPVHSPENRRIKVGIEYGSGPNEVSASFLGANSSSCTIEALSPELHLNIPCPIEKKQVCARLAPGVYLHNSKKWNYEAGGYERLNEDELTYKYYVTGGSWRPEGGGVSYACARWRVEGPNGEWVEFGRIDCNPKQEWKALWSNIGVEVNGETISPTEIGGMIGLLNVYCDFSTLWSDIWRGLAPSEWFGHGGGAGKLKIGIGYGEGAQSAAAKIVDIDSSSCKLSIPGANINLNIPCPVREIGPRKITAKVKYGSGPYSASDSFASVGSSCSIKLKEEVRLNLSIPCPIKKIGKRVIKAKVRYGSGPYSASDSFASVGSSCSIKLKEEVKLNLRISCPVKGNGKKRISAKIKYGAGPSSASDSYASVIGGNGCSFSLKENVRLNLFAPCPAKKDFLILDTSYAYSSSADFFVSYDSDDDDNCIRTIKLKTVFPIPKPPKRIVITNGDCTNLHVESHESSSVIYYKIGVYYV